MSEYREKIAELYYRSGSIKFGEFELSIHKDHPELPKSPWYLHYPKDEKDPGFALMPELFELVGAEFYDMCESLKVPIRPRRIAGLPKGALGIADAWARCYVSYPDNLLEFDKIQHKDGRTDFFGPVKGAFLEGDELASCEDHISGARNNLLFSTYARNVGLVVTNILVVVERQQGGRENLAKQGIELHSIFTGDQILEYGLAEGEITRATFEQVQEYRAANQFSLAGLNK